MLIIDCRYMVYIRLVKSYMVLACYTTSRFKKWKETGI